MLRINLLPESARKVAPSKIEQLHRTPLVWIVGVAMLVFPLLLILPMQFRRKQLQQLNGKIERLQPKKAELDQLQRTLQQLRAQEVSFRELATKRHLWSKRFNTLSNLTPDGVWFTELTLDQAKGLVLQGSAIGEGHAETAGIGRLVQALKADPDFASAIKDIQIESIKRTQERDIEIVQFTLTCLLTEGHKP